MKSVTTRSGQEGRSLQILKRYLLFGVFIIPTHATEKWKVQKYKNIPSNEVEFSRQGISIQVKKSASPLIYPMDGQNRISGFKIEGEFYGLPSFKDPKKQGEKGQDDYPLRVGFIIPGEKKLTGLKRFLAPQWVKDLYAGMPSGIGLDHILFFNVTQNPDQLNRQRTHPSSDLIQEKFIGVVSKPGKFNIDYTFDKPIDAVALWVSIDGDDTKSEYRVVISNLEVKIP